MRSLLFVPADSERKLEKGLDSGADALILDLEDSIALDRKPLARDMARAFLARAFLKDKVGVSSRPRLYVRLNALQTGLVDDDLDIVLGGQPDGVLLPKAEGGPSIIELDAKISAREAIHGIEEGHTSIIAIATETAAALFVGGSYRGASERLSGLTWGAEDLSAELGARANRDTNGRFTDPYRFARVICLAAANAARVAALDTVFVDFRDEAGLRREAEEACRDGFTGKLAIHPSQVAAINAVFTPCAEAIAKAARIVAAFAAKPDSGVVGLDGVMYDRPHLLNAQRLLSRAAALNRHPSAEPV